MQSDTASEQDRRILFFFGLCGTCYMNPVPVDIRDCDTLNNFKCTTLKTYILKPAFRLIIVFLRIPIASCYIRCVVSFASLLTDLLSALAVVHDN